MQTYQRCVACKKNPLVFLSDNCGKWINGCIIVVEKEKGKSEKKVHGDVFDWQETLVEDRKESFH